MPEIDLILIAQTLTAAGVIVGAVYSVWKWVWPTFRTLSALPAKIDKIYYEVTPNNGASIKDTINHLSKEVTAVAARQWSLVATQADPVWETNDRGECLRANTAMLSLVERDMEQMQANGWENIIHDDDAEWVLSEWSRAVSQRRAFEATFRVEAYVSKRVFKVTCISTAFKTSDGSVLGYIGRYTQIEEVA